MNSGEDELAEIISALAQWCKENDRKKKRREMFRVTSQSTMEAEKEVVGSEGDTKMAE